MRRRLPLMLSPVSLAAFSTAPVAAPGATPPTGPVARPFADHARNAAPALTLPPAPGAGPTPPRGSLLDLSV